MQREKRGSCPFPGGGSHPPPEVSVHLWVHVFPGFCGPERLLRFPAWCLCRATLGSLPPNLADVL